MSSINPEIDTILDKIDSANKGIVKDILNCEIQSNLGGVSSSIVQQHIIGKIDSLEYNVDDGQEEVSIL